MQKQQAHGQVAFQILAVMKAEQLRFDVWVVGLH